ncbi:HAD-IC family P-type ATPase [Actinobaculum sp. 313]|uniref:HAD-IC family P-type ATPase n=1 Tax=Actinobaculum sp. 313 TaxID=2495645 RepID=UPI000D5288BA|nr:HAD-IC family P-type ATPase [Actinobaculum sp. 313]AWE41596.1 magnesium-transporting ATPase [Actinobaculum sp. 313]
MDPVATDPTYGLSSQQVRERIAAGEVNTLPPRSGRSTWQIIRDNVFTRINALLGVLFALVMVTGSWMNGAFGLLIVANSIIGIIQELRAKHTLDSLAVVGEAHPTVRREGREQAVERDDVVLGDILVIKPGEQIVVDGVVSEADYLEIDESLLTGESDPIPKEPGDEIMSGSFVSSGTGTYRATKVGADAYAAQLTAAAAKFSLVHSELQSGINRILQVITWILIPVGIVTIIGQIRVGENDWRAIILAVAAALVPMIPEGLVLITSTAFALGVIRLGYRKCLVNELPAIEGLARVDVVCADKTGTLTENAMAFGRLEVLGTYDEEEARMALRQLAAADSAPNSSMLAIIDGVGQAEHTWDVAEIQPFTSAKKWSGVSFHEQGHWVLGAPDVLVDAESAAGVRAGEIAATGLRVLLLGRASATVTDDAAPGRVDPVALVILEQRVRPDAADTLEYFRSQGVDVKIISGDNAESVGAVTRSLGVEAGEPVDARTLTEANFSETVNDSQVFGRVTPQQKRSMVAALQEAGHTVAMTGDGVNDVLALKDADLGVAMGSGTAATRSVAKIVLLDDRFATLPHVVGEGRRVLGNIERVANLFLTKTIYSSILAVLVLLFSLPFPFQPIHVTITGWFTIGIPAFLLSLPPNNEKARSGFVQRVLRLGVPAGAVVAAASFVTYLLVRVPEGTETQATQASTAALLALIISATWVLATVARPYEWWKMLLILLPLLGYGIIFTANFTQRIFILDSSNTHMMLTGMVIGLIGAALIEGLWWMLGAITGERKPLWKPRAEREAEAAQRRIERAARKAEEGTNES